MYLFISVVFPHAQSPTSTSLDFTVVEELPVPESSGGVDVGVLSSPITVYIFLSLLCYLNCFIYTTILQNTKVNTAQHQVFSTSIHSYAKCLSEKNYSIKQPIRNIPQSSVETIFIFFFSCSSYPTYRLLSLMPCFVFNFNSKYNT